MSCIDNATQKQRGRVMLTARLHPLKSKNGREVYSIVFRGKLLVERSGDPECDAARALLAQSFTGKLYLFDAGGFSIAKDREPWGISYIYTPRHPMLRTIIDIEKAARLRTVETGSAPRFRNLTCAQSPYSPETEAEVGEYSPRLYGRRLDTVHAEGVEEALRQTILSPGQGV
jgi:hypothetical protein